MLSQNYSTRRMVKMLKDDAYRLQQQISNLYLEFPELVDDDEMLRVDMLEGTTNLKELAAVIVAAIGDARELYDGTKPRIDAIKVRQKRYKMRDDFLRGLLFKILQHANVRKLEVPEATLSIKNGTQQLVGNPDPATLPDELCRIIREPDKVKIKAALLAGDTVPGFVLSNSAPSLAVHGLAKRTTADADNEL